MKKAIKSFSLTILVIVGVVIFVIGLMILLPFDYLKYKRSAYYKKERKKYGLFAASSWHFEMYNEIIKYDLPIRFVANPEDPSLECGRFVFEDTLILPDVFSFEFDSQSDTWRYCSEDEDERREILSLDEYLENEIADANELTGQAICKDAVVLIDGDCVDDLEKAKAEKRFLVYEDNRAEVLKQFCETKLEKEES